MIRKKKKRSKLSHVQSKSGRMQNMLQGNKSQTRGHYLHYFLEYNFYLYLIFMILPLRIKGKCPLISTLFQKLKSLQQTEVCLLPTQAYIQFLKIGIPVMFIFHPNQIQKVSQNTTQTIPSPDNVILFCFKSVYIHTTLVTSCLRYTTKTKTKKR